MKKYVYKDAYPEKVFRGVFKEETDPTIVSGTYHGFEDDAGLEPFTEASELDIVRKFLLKDLLRNHKISLSRAKLIIDSIFRFYDTLISAFGVSNSLLTAMLTKVDNIVDKLQSAVLKRGGEMKPQEESRKSHGLREAEFKGNYYEKKSTDPTMFRELDLYIDNNESLYRSNLMPIIQNIKRKIKSGKYDHKLAPKLWMYLVEAGLKKYGKEFGDRWNDLLSVPDRKLLSQKYADVYYDAIVNGEYD